MALPYSDGYTKVVRNIMPGLRVLGVHVLFVDDTKVWHLGPDSAGFFPAVLESIGGGARQMCYGSQVKRLIELAFPIRKVSEESVRDRTIRQGHISTLHTWWARRPLAASRATALATLLPDDPSRRAYLLELVKDISPWEVVSKAESPRLEEARRLIRESYGGRAPKVLDCFAGGGSIPLEALRLGCDTYALDYNPVAVLLNKAILEYPHRFGIGYDGPTGVPHGGLGLDASTNPLVDAIRYWGNWMLEEAREELERFYPNDPDGSIPVGWLWARTVPCQNPVCNAEIPLMYQTWLANKKNKRIAIRIIPNRQEGRIDFDIVGQDGRPIDFDPDEGTVSRAHVRCPLCGGSIDNNTTCRLFREGRSGQRMVAVVLHHPCRPGKTYRLATDKDLEAYHAAAAALAAKREALRAEWGMDPVPDEGLTYDPRSILVTSYLPDVERVLGSLFNTRQKLALITFAEKARQAHTQMLAAGADAEFAKAVATYLALAVDMTAAFCNVLARWENTSEAIKQLFSRQALPMVWNYAELHPFSHSTGSVGVGWEYYLNVVSHCSQLSSPSYATVVRGSATDLPWPDCYFDAVLTDPPYYDNVPYADLSDFFYVWLKRTVGDLYPELFATPLVPKSEEIVQDPSRHGGRAGAKAFFEQMATQAFREIHRVLKPDGLAVIVFAHKTTEAWEAIINALLSAGLYMTASWPIHTEMQARLRAQKSGVLASSIYMVCRKRTANEIGDFGAVRREIEQAVRTRLTQFWAEGIRGADFFMSAIGPAVEAFGKYERVEKPSGEPMTVAELLDHVRKVVSEYALERIMHASGAMGGVDAATRFYLLYRWTYNHARVPFDEARKLATGVGVELTDLWTPGGIVVKENEYVRVPNPLDRAKDERFAQKTRFGTMIDALHYALYLYDRNDQKKLVEHLAETYGGSEPFWQVAQAISEVLPDGDKEKQLLQGLLYGRRSYAVGMARADEHSQMPLDI
jgi:adenine-specific DNA methylase